MSPDTPDVWVRIVARASSLFERLEEEFEPVRSLEELARLGSRRQRWMEAAANGDPHLFARRLANDRIDESRVAEALSDVRKPTPDHLPSWVGPLQEALEVANTGFTPRTSTDSDKTREPLPFEEILQPFVSASRRRLNTRVNMDERILSMSAHRALEAALLERLSYAGALVLQFEFSLFRSRAGGLQHLLNRPDTKASSACYARFAGEMLRGRLLDFFVEYSALARVLARICEAWVVANAEFCERLAVDIAKISVFFGDGKELGPVVAVKEVNSDQPVKVVTFESGLKLVYKVKDLGAEAAYFRLLGWLNRRGLPLRLKELRVLPKGDYGWIEHVRPSLCASEEEVERYYQRSGMLLCLLYMLEAAGVGQHNVVVCGEDPVLIDFETFMHPRTAFKKEEAHTDLSQLLRKRKPVYSFLRSGLLAALDAPDNSASPQSEQDSRLWVTHWEHVNTDRMTFRWEHDRLDRSANRPSLHNVAVEPYEYVEEIVAGFRQMYEFVQTYQADLMVSDGPIVELSRQKTRYSFRSQEFYRSLLSRTLRPECLRDGVDRSIELETLARSFLKSEEKQRFWPLLRAEREALEALETPVFHGSPDGDSIYFAGEPLVKAAFVAPGYRCAEFRLRNTTALDLQRQLSVIRWFFASKIPAAAWNVCTVDASRTKPASFDPVKFQLFTEEECRSIISRAEQEVGWGPARVYSVKGGDWIPGEGERVGFVLMLGDHPVVIPDVSRTLEDLIEPKIKAIWGAEVNPAIDPQIVRYTEGGYHNEHTDMGYDYDARAFSVVCYLNDDYEGGRTGFPRLKMTVTPKAGQSILFPAWYPHYSETVRSGRKYVLVTWFEITNLPDPRR